MLRNFIYKWERKLAQRDNNRVVRSFEWGLDFLNRDIFTPTNGHSNDKTFVETNGHSNGNGQVREDGFPGKPDKSELQTIFDFNKLAISESQRFFSAPPVKDFGFDGEWLTFQSSQQTPYDENNTVHARFFPVPARSPGETDSP